jgi:hypothetical protein
MRPLIAQTEPLQVTPSECLEICDPLPKPLSLKHEDILLWHFRVVQWSETCGIIPLRCSRALSNDK